MDYLKLQEISTHGGTQAREQTDWLVVDEYVHAMQDGATFPPIVVFWDGSDYWLADGFHRVEAATRAGLETLPAEVKQGTRRDAVLYACGANAAHGLRRTNADKRRAVLTLLEDEEWREKGDGWIARQCVVSTMTVGRIRAELISNNVIDAVQERTVTRNGVTYPMNTKNIGKPAPAEPEATPSDEPLPFDDVPEDEDDWEDEATVPPTDPAPRMAVHFSSETPEHYTPQHVIERVIACMGGIDLDPCSNSHENPNVPAAAHYTLDDDGLSQEWQGAVYMNPPYGREIEAWVSKLVESYERGAVSEAIALVPARTDTQWWQLLNDYHICFVVGRLAFIGNEGPAPFPSAVVYLGGETAAFVDAFEDLGPIWHRTRRGYCFGE